MNSNATTTKTPGCNGRLSVRFTFDKNGRKLAHHWSARNQRWWRVGTLAAEQWVAQDLADQV